MKTSPKLLLVDDDKDFREVLVTKFRAAGFDVAAAEDGEQALKKAEEAPPDLILMDVKMPKMDGIQALVKLKGNPRTKDIKVVLLTAYGDPEMKSYADDQRFAGDLGASEYLLKSQDLDEMVKKVKALLPANT